MSQCNRVIQGIIFDLDGTLLNTLYDLHAAINYALDTLSMPLRTLQEVKCMIGDGASKLVMRALPDNAKHMHKDALDLFAIYYNAHNCDKTMPYDGISELIALLRGGRKLAVLSNKPNCAAQYIVDKYFPDSFYPVLGSREGVALKPHPAAAQEIAKLWDIPPAHIAMVGDSLPDILTAKAAGMLPIAVNWGYGNIEQVIDAGAPIICDSVAQLRKVLIDGMI